MNHTAEKWGSKEELVVRPWSEVPPCAFKSVRFIVVLVVLSWALIGGTLYVAIH